MPFGGNVHKCIGMHFGGMEVKAIIHQLLQRYRWDVPADYEVPIDYATGPIPGDGLPIRWSRSTVFVCGRVDTLDGFAALHPLDAEPQARESRLREPRCD